MSAEPAIRVLVADDQELVRRGFVALLDAEDGIDVVGEAANGSEAYERAIESRPDVILMDVRMPLLDGIDATARITADDRLSRTRILMLTTFNVDQYVYAALRAGASGFLLKDTRPNDLLDAVRTVAEGNALIAPTITQRLIAEFTARPDPERGEEALADLTDREREVLVAVGRGLNNGEVAERLFISPLTAKTHVSRILTKLRLRDRAQLVVIAYETGLIVPGNEPER